MANVQNTQRSPGDRGERTVLCLARARAAPTAKCGEGGKMDAVSSVVSCCAGEWRPALINTPPTGLLDPCPRPARRGMEHSRPRGAFVAARGLEGSGRRGVWLGLRMVGEPPNPSAADRGATTATGRAIFFLIPDSAATSPWPRDWLQLAAPIRRRDTPRPP
jgi:hypothetical protein